MPKLDDIGEFSIKRAACVALPAAELSPVLQALVQDGWSVMPVHSVGDLTYQEPDCVGTLLLDGGYPIAHDLLVWCEQSELWRGVPKVVLSENNVPFSTVLPQKPGTPPQDLIEAMERAQRQYRRRWSRREEERRRHFRQRCAAQCFIQQAGRFIDISLGGAAMLVPAPVPSGTCLTVHISDYDPLLRSVRAEVLRGYARADGYHIHVRFMDVSPRLEKALQQHLLALQIRDIQLRTR